MRNKDRFVRRRQRLLGPGGATLKVRELVYNLLSKATVSAFYEN